MAWYDGNSSSQTHDVGTKKANAWGFYDMHGNVLEWCSDWFAKTAAGSVDPKGPASGSFRVLRGGSWFYYARDCRSAYRQKRDPSIRNFVFGFRLAITGGPND
jgi:formylglycine-generating enzyme required for sulfatase activity